MCGLMSAMVGRSVLVTGASGFIGTRLVRRLVESQVAISCLVRSRSRTEHLQLPGVQLMTGDVTDMGSVERSLEQSRASTVFHLAGRVRALHRDDFMRINAGGAETVAAACAARPEAPVLVVVSSLAAAGPCASNELHTEDEEAMPISEYGRSKLAGERAAMKFANAVPISVVRPPVVFGPGDRAVLEIFHPIARWGIHLVPGWKRGRTNRLSLIHVDDLVDGLLFVAAKGERLCESGAPGQGIYFLSAAEQLTHAQFGRAIAIALGQKPPAVIPVPGPLLRIAGLIADARARVVRGRRHAGWINRDKIAEALAGSWTCSSAKIQSQSSWAPARPLAERLHETAQWYREARWL